MTELASSRTRAILKVAYFEGHDIYRFRCDDPDLELEWDLEALEAHDEEDARRILRDLTLRLQRLGREVDVEQYFAPEVSGNDLPGPDGKYHIEPIRRKLF